MTWREPPLPTGQFDQAHDLGNFRERMPAAYEELGRTARASRVSATIRFWIGVAVVWAVCLGARVLL